VLRKTKEVDSNKNLQEIKELLTLCDIIINNDYEKYNKLEIENLLKTQFLNLNSESSNYFDYTFDENINSIEYLVAKESRLYDKNMSILKLYSTLRLIITEYKEKIKSLKK